MKSILKRVIQTSLVHVAALPIPRWMSSFKIAMVSCTLLGVMACVSVVVGDLFRRNDWIELPLRAVMPLAVAALIYVAVISTTRLVVSTYLPGHPKAKKRFRFQFSLGTVLIAFTLLPPLGLLVFNYLSPYPYVNAGRIVQRFGGAFRRSESAALITLAR